MKILFLSLTYLVFTIQASFANEVADIKSWEIIKFEQDYYLKLKSDSNKMVDIMGMGRAPFLEKILCSKQNSLCLIIYFAGESGTQRIVKSWRAVVYNKANGYYSGDFPYKYEDGDRKFPQPEYVFSETKLTIKDETSDLNEVIHIENVKKD